MELKLDADVVGIFEAIDSFIVKTQNKYCVIGKLKDGKAEKGFFLNIAFNNTFGLTTRITHIDEIEFASTGEKCLILSSQCDDEEVLGLLLSMNVGAEQMKITVEGED